METEKIAKIIQVVIQGFVIGLFFIHTMRKTFIDPTLLPEVNVVLFLAVTIVKMIPIMALVAFVLTLNDVLFFEGHYRRFLKELEKR